MAIANLQWLKTLLASLNPNEINYFKQRLKFNSDRQNRSSKMLEFLDNLENEEDVPKSEKNRKMISASEDRILNYLLDDINLKKTQDSSHKSIHLYKKLLKAQVLFIRGCSNRCLEHLNALLRNSDAQNNLSFKEQVCSFKLSVLASINDQVNFLKTLELKKDLEYRRSQELRLIGLYHQVKLRNSQHLSENTDILNEQSLNLISQIQEKHKSDLTLFIYQISLAIHLENKGNYDEAILAVNQAEEFVESALFNNLIQSRLELAAHKARLYLNQGNYIDASFSASVCEEKSPQTTLIYYRALKIQFLVNFQKNRHDKNEWIEHANFNKVFLEINANSIDIISWYYLKACHLHQQGHFNKCLKTIDFISKNFKIEPLLNIYLRLHKISIYIQDQSHDAADREIESFRKFIQRNKHENLLIQHQKESLFQFFKTYKIAGFLVKPDIELDDSVKISLPLSFDYTGYLDLFCFKSWAQTEPQGDSSYLGAESNAG